MLHGMGPCSFDPQSLSFAGTPVEQAACLIRPVLQQGHLGPPRNPLPTALAGRVAGVVPVPPRAALVALINDAGLGPRLAADVIGEVSHARDGGDGAPPARYFVIHDTSGPRFGSFPADLDVNVRINNLERFNCADGSEIAHAFVNRQGAVLVGHDFGVPWRATKFERALGFGTSLKGLFLHVELIQPRSRSRHGHDVRAPTPGFSDPQYQRLALLYTIASVRAGSWLIPAFHAVIDGDVRGGHDDPQNFEVDAFAQALDAVGARLAALAAAAGDRTAGDTTAGDNQKTDAPAVPDGGAPAAGTTAPGGAGATPDEDADHAGPD